MNPIIEFKKPLRARKTMSISPRQQLQRAKEVKAVEEAEKLSNGTPVANNHVHLKRADTSDLGQNSPKEHSPQPESKQTLLHPPTLEESVTNLIVNSEINIFSSSHEGSQDVPHKVYSKDSDLQQFLNTGALQDLLYQYLQEPSSLLPRPMEVHLDSESPAQHFSRSEHELSVTSPMCKGEVTEINDKTHVKQTMPVSEKEDGRFQLLEENTNSSVLPVRAQRKRRPSETNEEGIFPKCIKKSDETTKVCKENLEKRQVALEQIKCFVQSQLDNSMKTMDQKLEVLKQRIDQTQCLRKHEDVSIKIVKKISRLDRRIDAIIAYRQRELSRKALPTGAPLQDKMLVSLPPQHGGSAGSTPAQSKETPETPSVLKKTIPEDTESSEDVVFISLVEKTPDAGKVNTTGTGVQQKKDSGNATTLAETLFNFKKQVFIDLTDGDNCSKGVCKETEKSVSKKINSARESRDPKHLQPVLQSSNQLPQEFRHLPPLPKLEPPPESISRFRYSLPPQKLKLIVAEVETPKGFGLQWDVSEVEPRCAPPESFYVYICMEITGQTAPTSWIRLSEIKAMPLPMACSLAHKIFLHCSKCYFAIVPKDIYGRYGPISDIQSILVT